MKTSLLSILLLSLFITAPVHAGKPDKAGKGKPDMEQNYSDKGEHKTNRHGDEDDNDRDRSMKREYEDEDDHERDY
ncbi:MAG: hypothetical protein OEY48_05180, partial [Gammaproteobacteria bacterium]|nr:hypothetical protein [Gammaproteobacteria bacterium]